MSNFSNKHHSPCDEMIESIISSSFSEIPFVPSPLHCVAEPTPSRRRRRIIIISPFAAGRQTGTVSRGAPLTGEERGWRSGDGAEGYREPQTDAVSANAWRRSAAARRLCACGACRSFGTHCSARREEGGDGGRRAGVSGELRLRAATASQHAAVVSRPENMSRTARQRTC